MRERLTYSSQTVEIDVTREIKIPRTREGYEEKSFIYFNLGGIERSLFTRKVENFCLPSLIGFNYQHLSYAETYLNAWNILKEREFNIVPETWKLSDDRVATTNLIEYGGSVYDQKIDAIIERDTLPNDKDFIKIPFIQIQKASQKLVDLANNSGIELMADGPYHLAIRPDLSWYLIILDIGKVRIHSGKLGRDEKHNNQFYSDKALREFAKIQSNIGSLRLARGLI